MTDDKITKLPVRHKKVGKDGKFLEVVHNWECYHDGGFLIDDAKSEVECAKCGALMNPMYVLKKMAGDETAWHLARARYQDEMKRLTERSRTRCRHCGEMTPISRN